MEFVSRAIRRIEGAVLAVAMLVMAASTIVNVLARNLTGDSLAATEELNQLLIVVVCFVGLSHAAGEGRHIRMTALSDALPRRARRALVALVCGSTSALLAGFAVLAVRYALGVDRTTPVLGVPLKLVYAVAPLGLGLGAIQYALAAVATLRGPGVFIAYGVRDEPVPVSGGPPEEG